jgi:hypothetical protein
MGFFRWLFRLGPRIPAHTLGIHDLSGGAAEPLMEADRAALAPLFRRVSESSDAPPRSTLLLVYCTIGADGGILNSPRTLREIIRDAGAPVVIVRGLVTEMKKGTSMPRAWTKLVHRAPAGDPAERPHTLVACELGKLAFR